MFDSLTFSISISRPWRDVYERIWRPENFPEWAAGLSGSTLEKFGDVWKADGPAGPVKIRFTGHNSFGVMDHTVDTGSTAPVYVPLRVIANADSAEVLLTLFRQPRLTDEQFAADAQSIRRDLAALRSLLTG